MKGFMGAFVLGLAISVVLSFVIAWPFMLAMGNLHAFMPSVPAGGFWDVWSVTIWLTSGIAVMRADSSSS